MISIWREASIYLVYNVQLGFQMHEIFTRFIKIKDSFGINTPSYDQYASSVIYSSCAGNLPHIPAITGGPVGVGKLPVIASVVRRGSGLVSH